MSDGRTVVEAYAAAVTARDLDVFRLDAEGRITSLEIYYR